MQLSYPNAKFCETKTTLSIMDKDPHSEFE